MVKDYYHYLAKSPKRSTMTVELTKRKCICRKVKSALTVEVIVTIGHKKSVKSNMKGGIKNQKKRTWRIG